MNARALFERNTRHPAVRLALGVLSVALLPLALAACDDDDPAGPEMATYEVTVNNTAGALQPLSPPVVALHAAGTALYQNGAAASGDLERVAESGDPGPLSTTLGDSDQVAAVEVGSGPITPGNSATFTLQGPADMRISLVSMLVCTNDGFVALNAVTPPSATGASETFDLADYDAGTEQNTEASSDLVPPCVMATTGSAGGTGADQPGVAEGGTVGPHPGIDADTDGDDILTPDQHQWADPAATVTIERTG